MEIESAEEIKLKNIRYDMIWYGNVMLDEIIQRHAYNNSSNTSQLKTRQDKTRHDEVYIYSLHIMTMATTMTMTMTIIIQWIVMAWR